MGRIALVSEHASPLTAPGQDHAGSQSLYVADLSAALSGIGHEVVVYTRRDDPRTPARTRVRAGYEVVHVPSGPARRITGDEATAHAGDFARFLSTDWNTNRPDVVHAQGWLSGITAVLGARHSQVPVVQTFHTLGADLQRHQDENDSLAMKRLAVERLLGQEVARIVATCSGEAEDVLKMGISRAKLSVIPHGVDLNLFTPQGVVAKRNGVRRIVSVGRLLPHQGFDDLIRALTSLEDAELVIVGGGSVNGRLRGDTEARRLRALARVRGVAHRVTLAGHLRHHELPALLRSADVVACTPWYESFGVAALEAMACGVPVVATSVGGFVDTVVNGQTGIQVPPRNPGAIAKALRTLLPNDTRRELLGAAGHDRMHARYSWHRIVSELMQVYTAARRSSSTGSQTVPLRQSHVDL
ncbi:glycosyltransferase family 1 protein [Lentzea sp. NEAU-D13]|uniref:Glycosyltransferase family 1 protein n=1 Tax=Lentzea alba TaxID=2714351 RepID=A0A7C9W2M0_9PSEU|nr:glycosyltransferase [Lentzea alba]NGY62219.1 glycosyltransferase family 1 protein [Lentzea alba]